MTRRRRAAAALVALAIVVVGVREFAGRSGAAGPERAAQAAPPAATSEGEPVVKLAAAAQRDGAIATMRVHNAAHRERLRAYGRVLDLQPLIGLANDHDRAAAARDIATAKLAASRSAFERAQKLYKDRQNISAAELQSAEAAYRVDQAGVAAAQAQLRTLAATAQQGWGAALADAVANDSDLLKQLIGRQKMLLQVTLRPGQTVEPPRAGAVVALDGGGRVALDFVSAASKTDPAIQGISFYFTAPAESGLLPGMSVLALLPEGATVEGAAIPAAAVVWEGGRAWAYFRIAPDTFARRPVSAERRAADGFYLMPGLPEGAEIVVGGAQILLSEEFRAQTGAGGQGDED